MKLSRRVMLFILIPMIIMVMLCFVPSGALSQEFLPDEGSFNGLRWGQYLGELKGMKFSAYDRRYPGELYYTHEGDPLQMAHVKLAYVQYGFWKGIFSSLVFGTEGRGNWEGLKDICFQNYGYWHRPDWRIERYYWVGTQSAMTLEYDEVTSMGELYVYSKDIYERELAQKQALTGARLNRFWLY